MIIELMVGVGDKPPSRLQVLCALLDGEELDRHGAARIVGCEHQRGYQILDELAEAIPGVTRRREGRRTLYRYEHPLIEDRPRDAAVIASCLGASLGPLFRGSSYEEGILAARRYLIERCAKPRRYANVERKFWFVSAGGEFALPEARDVLDDVIDCVLRSRRAQVVYCHFFGDEEELIVEPLSVAIHLHQLYVFVRIGEEVRALRFARIQQFEPLGETFKYPSRAEFDPDRLLSDCLGVFISGDDPVVDVELRLSKKWGYYALTHRWHPSQRVIPTQDGTVVSLRVRECPELLTWILGFGDDAEVLAPESLRDAVKNRLQRAAAKY